MFITNHFETRSTLEALRRERLCLPSKKRVIDEPDPTPTILGRPQVTCPGGPDTCTFRVDNIGSAPAGPFDVLVRADSGNAVAESNEANNSDTETFPG